MPVLSFKTLDEIKSTIDLKQFIYDLVDEHRSYFKRIEYLEDKEETILDLLLTNLHSLHLRVRNKYIYEWLSNNVDNHQFINGTDAVLTMNLQTNTIDISNLKLNELVIVIGAIILGSN